MRLMGPAAKRILTGPATLVALASATAALTAFLVNVLTARALGPELRGSIALALQLSYFLAPVLTLGADKAALKSQGLSVPPRLSLLLLATSGITAFLAVFLPPYLWLAAPMALASAFLALRRAEVLTTDSVRSFVVPFIGYQTFVLVSSGFLFWRGVQWWPMWALPYILPIPFLLPRILRHRDPAARTPWLANVRLVGSHLAQLTTMRGQRLWLPALDGAASLGLFTVVATATEPLFWFAQALADHRTGTGSVPGGSRIRALVGRLGRDGMLFAAAATAGGAALYFLLVPIFGEAFAPGRALILPLSIAGVVLALYRQSAGWLLSQGSESAYMRSEMATAGVSLIAYPTLIHFYGLMGAAWGTIGVYATGLALTLTAYSRVMNARK